MHLYNFTAWRYIALTAIIKDHTGSPKMARKERFEWTKSHKGSKFSKIPLELLCTWRTVVLHRYCCFFSAASDNDTAERQIQNRIFWSILNRFEEGYRRQLTIDLDAVYAVCYRTKCALPCVKHFAVPSVGGATRFANLRWKFSKT